LGTISEWQNLDLSITDGPMCVAPSVANKSSNIYWVQGSEQRFMTTLQVITSFLVPRGIFALSSNASHKKLNIICIVYPTYSYNK